MYSSSARHMLQRLAATRIVSFRSISHVSRVAISKPPRPSASLAGLRLGGLAPRVSTRWYTPLTTDTPAEPYDYEKVKKLSVAKDPNTVLVDVREPSEYEQGHIPGAVNIPVKSSPGALGLDPEDFLDAFGFEKPDTEKNLVFYCLAGVRSTSAESLAATYGYQHRGNYKGSYEDWLAHEQK